MNDTRFYAWSAKEVLRNRLESAGTQGWHVATGKEYKVGGINPDVNKIEEPSKKNY